MRPIKFITLHHAAVHQEDINKAIQSFDRTHKERLHKTKNKLGYHIAYHYVIGWNGEVVATRSHEEIGFINTNNQSNRISLGVCLVGNFDEETPSDAQLKALHILIKELKTLYPGVLINGHRDIYPAKSCPGRLFPLSEMKALYNTNTIMSFFKAVWEVEVPATERTFTSYEDKRPITVEDVKYLLDIGLYRDNKKDEKKNESLFQKIVDYFKK